MRLLTFLLPKALQLIEMIQLVINRVSFSRIEKLFIGKTYRT